ncbi:MAG: glutathionylspermidine synthase family protein [Rhodospirillaceae bacterium]
MANRTMAGWEPFGTVLGHGPGGVPSYSSDYKTVDEKAMPDRAAFKSELDDVYMGHKWQCVEYCRRWMYVNKGYVFDNIAMAYEIFRLGHVTVVKDGAQLPLKAFRNGSQRPPEPGALLIWNEGGWFERTGHVAVVAEVTATTVRIAEQNVDHRPWPDGAGWARELPMTVDAAGAHWVFCTYDDTSILGWVIQTDDDTHAQAPGTIDPKLFNLRMRETKHNPAPWLDVTRPEQASYVKFMGGQRLATKDEHLGQYFVMSETARNELKRATNELHAMFIRATDYVLEHPDVLERFNLPTALLPRLLQSWQNRRAHNITARFDFALTENGLKVYEYNTDSAGCHMECGMTQGLWAAHHGVTEGRDPGARLFKALTRSWQDSRVDDPLHIFQDEDEEEDYHALYMKSAAEAAGVRCKLVRGLKGLDWDGAGRVIDADGEQIDWVWKTWAWETALDQLRDEAVDEEAFLKSHEFGEIRDHPPRLIDVLLRPEVMVFEPLWSLIPSNKAILPVLWQLYPNYPYLLETTFGLTDSLAAKGYVRKPIVGRCGGNIAMVDDKANVLEETDGQFHDRDDIYQELFPLPKIGGLYTQVCTFTVDGIDAGACVRCDENMIIRSRSDLPALRVVPDEELDG